MKAQATQEPESIFIEQTQDGYCVRLRKNIEQYEETFEEETQVMYQYDEVILKLSNIENIEDYVTDNFDYLFNIADQREYEDKVSVIQEYYNKGFITESDLDDYVTAGIISSKDEVIL
jgi:hypothetical protein